MERDKEKRLPRKFVLSAEKLITMFTKQKTRKEPTRQRQADTHKVKAMENSPFEHNDSHRRTTAK